ncbi:Beta-catenin-like protein, partial [Globisporangium splendens]
MSWSWTQLKVFGGRGLGHLAREKHISARDKLFADFSKHVVAESSAVIPLGRKARRPLVTAKAPSRTAQRSSAPKKTAKSKKPKVAKATTPSSGSGGGGGGATTRQLCDDDSENESAARLREQLLHVLVDRQRQEEEIVALRALARSLKEEVEQLEQLRAENARLHGELGDANRELERLRNAVNHKIPRHKVVAVQARAELECVKSQLEDEQVHCDQLRVQVAYFTARSDTPIRVSKPLQPRHGTTTINATRSSSMSKNLQDPWTRPGKAERETLDRERGAFLLQCRMDAVHDRENQSACGNDGSEKELRMRCSHSKGSRLSSSAISSSSEPSSSRTSHGDGGGDAKRLNDSSSVVEQPSPPHEGSDAFSAQVHRDLSGLDHELQELHLSLQKLPTYTKGGAFPSLNLISLSLQAAIMEDHFERVLDAAGGGGGDKRARDAAQEAQQQQQAKKRKHAASSASSASLSKQELDSLLATAAAQEMDHLDARALKSMVTALDKLIKKNALLRSKYADTPEKFMDSEVALDDELTKWKQVAAAPALYPHVVELDVVPMLLGLFAHENIDVRLDVIALLAELTDVDDADASLEPTRVLVKALLDHNLLSLLVTNLYQLDVPDIEHKDEESTGIYNSLQILENVADLEPSACEQVCKNTQILPFLMQQVRAKRPFGQNKLYASEILSILLQSGPQPREIFMKQVDRDSKKTVKQVDLMDELLQAIALYRKRNPATDEEEEFVENLVNSLCSVLLAPAAQTHFRHLEGLELVLRCMKDRTQFVFRGALRILDHAIMGNARNCERLVEVGGLKIVFSVFMGKKTAKIKNKKVKGAEKAKEEENTMSIMASLCALLTPEAKYDVFDRFHAKFVENDMEKVDRLVDLFVKYHQRVVQSDGAEDENDEEDEDEDERYLRRLDAGLFTLQRITHAVAHLCHFSKKTRAYVMVKFHERSIDMELLSQVLEKQLEMLVSSASVDDADVKAENGGNDAEAKSVAGNSEKEEAQRKLLMRLLETLRLDDMPPSSDSDDQAVKEQPNEEIENSEEKPEPQT